MVTTRKVNQRVKLNVTSLSKIGQKVSELLSVEQMAMVGVKRHCCGGVDIPRLRELAHFEGKFTHF